jgi:cytochrome oxidase Cu insertion factor (SCO1/SenC/PrrC family)
MNKMTVLAVSGAALGLVFGCGVVNAADAVTGMAAQEQVMLVIAAAEDDAPATDEDSKPTDEGKSETASGGAEGKESE